MNCPVCGFTNEDGALFCDKCKSDLEMPAPPVQATIPMTDQSASPATPSSPAPVTEEPIPLEPITLEPVADSASTADGEGNRAAPEPAAHEVPASQESTGDHPAISSESPPSPSDIETVPAPEPTTTAPAAETIANPKLVVVRGQRIDIQYPLYPGKNYLGRTDDKPVDIDLEDQESPDRIWTSRQHAVITFEDGKLSIEDLNSLNGTFVNRSRVHPGQVTELAMNDVIQVGTVHLKVSAG